MDLLAFPSFITLLCCKQFPLWKWILWVIFQISWIESSLPLASRSTRFSFSLSAAAVFNLTPKAPVTSLLASAAHVSGLALYGCMDSAHFLALIRDSKVASASGFRTTNGWPVAKAWAANGRGVLKKCSRSQMSLTNFTTAKDHQGVCVIHPFNVIAALLIGIKQHQ